MNILPLVQAHAPQASLVVLAEEKYGPSMEPFTDPSLPPGVIHYASTKHFLDFAETFLSKERGESVLEEPPLFSEQSSEGIQKLEAMANQIADTDTPVLIQGESGVGKGVLAHYLHAHSRRRSAPFLKVNCAALPSELLESELFGYEKGAFTGANGLKPGKFECAKGGTILLDEIGELSPPMQAKLLHVLEDKRYARLGAKGDILVQARVLVATNKDLEAAIHKGSFRKDLYYRLQVVNLMIPPLRARRQEIPMLVDYFFEKFSRQYHRPRLTLSSDELCRLENYSWPGNVRELENLVKRLVLFQDRRFLEEAIKSEVSLNGKMVASECVAGGLKEATRRICRETERNLILKTLEHTNWNRTTTAKILKISYKTLLYKIQDCGLVEGEKNWEREPTAH